MKILVTGAAGFIGSKLMQKLAERGDEIVGIDNINDYYDPRLKYGRLRECGISCDAPEMEWGRPIQSTTLPNCHFIRLAIDDKEALDRLMEREKFQKVVNMAAQAGVRYSITNPYAYLQSNIVGFLNVLEACRNYGVEHLIFASSSSVYGMNTKVPYSEDDKTVQPVSLYAASKMSNELMAHAYSKLFFANAISKGEPIKVFNNGDMIRDFTYIDDIAEGTICAIDHQPEGAENVPFKVYNIGCSNPVKLMDFISEMESAFGKEAQKNFLPMQPGDVYQTNADTSKLEAECGYKPHWTLHDGIGKFMAWYKSGKNPLKD